ncbi:MAG: HPF/RaiA family ribosome-associated protein [Rhodothermaceae bacterium]|nr:HPF/RaiA family ribosome-associated protein [Rhodothermaceae bacterium]MXX57559.1 HPF/RaiA family ribosome-associated protein [Rhodothermaceae bacterium]MYD18528.1 HPF/RaiA family ribosome-associated protein [Rhodothermaceae bacterium]MYD57853.1 HPF/RaiA family ribosome-associated protein [Rhodothermaceae bacterium]MYI43537.1 HPF/RaiA family ribosome-associated protein [Rhodothermaceae bacterium]
MSEFAIEYYVEGTHLSQRQKDAIEVRLNKLAQGHRDIAGASVAVECVSGANRRAEYRVRLVVYRKPSNIAATRTQDSVRGAISEALEAVVRQIREQRERMRDRHRAARV